MQFPLLETKPFKLRLTAEAWSRYVGMSESQVIPSLEWQPAGTEPLALLLCIHGLGLHGGVYQALGKRMADLGVATFSLDVRGFGRWNEEKHSVLDLTACIDDICAKCCELRSEHPGVPLFLLGESMGGAIATQFVAKHEGLVDGLILCAPAKGVSEHKREVLRVFLQWLVNPWCPVEISAKMIQRAPHLVAPPETEPKIRLRFSAQELLHMGSFFSNTPRCAERIRKTPTLVLQGHKDKVIRSGSTLNLFDRLLTSNKHLVIIGNADHLIFQRSDPEQRSIELVRDFITEHSKGIAWRPHSKVLSGQFTESPRPAASV